MPTATLTVPMRMVAGPGGWASVKAMSIRFSSRRVNLLKRRPSASGRFRSPMPLAAATWRQDVRSRRGQSSCRWADPPAWAWSGYRGRSTGPTARPQGCFRRRGQGVPVQAVLRGRPACRVVRGADLPRLLAHPLGVGLCVACRCGKAGAGCAWMPFRTPTPRQDFAPADGRDDADTAFAGRSLGAPARCRGQAAAS